MYPPRCSLPVCRGVLMARMMCWGMLCMLAAMAPSTTPPMAHAATTEGSWRIASAVRQAITPSTPQPGEAPGTPRDAFRRSHAGDAVAVYLYLTTWTPTTLDVLRQNGVRVLQSDATLQVVYATVARDRLEDVAALPLIRWIGPPSYAMHRTGSVRSEGDAAMRANRVRADLGFSGRGVSVGIISDSLRDLATSVNSGDLPATLTIVNGQDGAADANALDEGRALAEIVHDLAPGARLLFHSAQTSLDFITAVRALTAAGSHVIVDDLGFFDQPVYEDGSIAQAVQEASARGVIYVSAAGNDARRHYRGVYTEFVPTDGTTPLHDFGGGNTRLNVRISAEGVAVLVLQWPNLFDGSANTADYDLLLVDSNGNTLAISDDAQLRVQAPPIEVIVYSNPANRPVTASLVIRRVGGETLPLTVNVLGNATITDRAVASGSISGHPCVRDVIAVGAVDANEPGFDTLENFSSQGPCEIVFPRRELRTKPDVAGADGVLTSLPDFTPFFGTSAAAPHVAAVAALLIEASGGPGALSPAQVRNTLRVAAVDADVPGVDNRFGHGVVDAFQAVQAIRARTNTPPQSVIDAPGDTLVIPPNTAVTFQGHCVDAEDNQPFTLAWNFGLLAPPSQGQNPSPITFSTVGSFMVTLTCTDATGLVDPTPATRTITVNTPPDSRITSPGPETTVRAGDSVSFAGTCSDPDGNGPFTFQWFFGGNAVLPTSNQQNPGAVVFDTPGTVTVSFACLDAVGTADPSPATVRVTIMPASVNTLAGSGSGGGGGCSVLLGQPQGVATLIAWLGNMCLPWLCLGGLWLWRRYGRRR